MAFLMLSLTSVGVVYIFYCTSPASSSTVHICGVVRALQMNWLCTHNAHEVVIRILFGVSTSSKFNVRGGLKRSARAVRLFGHLAILETHTLWY